MSFRLILAASIFAVSLSAAHAANTSVISQSGTVNGAYVHQRGATNTSVTFQDGTYNAAITRQLGKNNAAGISQSGTYNGAAVFQRSPLTMP